MRAIAPSYGLAGMTCGQDGEGRLIMTLRVSGADGRMVRTSPEAVRELHESLRRRFRMRLPALPTALALRRRAASGSGGGERMSEAALVQLADDLCAYFGALVEVRAVAQSRSLREFLMLGSAAPVGGDEKALSAMKDSAAAEEARPSARRRRGSRGRGSPLTAARATRRLSQGEGTAAVLSAASVLLRPLPTDEVALKGSRPRIVEMRALGSDQVFVWGFKAPYPVGFSATFDGTVTHVYSIIDAGEETQGHYQPRKAGRLELSFVDARKNRTIAMRSVSLTARAHVVTVEAYNAAHTAAMQLMQRHSQRSVVEKFSISGGEVALRAKVDSLEDGLARLVARNAKDVVRLRTCEKQCELLREQCVDHQKLRLHAESLAARLARSEARCEEAEVEAAEARCAQIELKQQVAKHIMAAHLAEAAAARAAT